MEKLETLEAVETLIRINRAKLKNNDLSDEKRESLLVETEAFEEVKKELDILQIFKNRMRILERDNYKVIKVDIFSDVPGFVEEYNKIIDWNGDSNE